MAEATGTNLTVNDPSMGNDSEPENKSGFMDTLGSADMMRQMALVVVLVICVAIAVFILIWAQEPDFRPLAKMETQELIETLDYMDANQIEYRLEGNTVYVRSDEFQTIRLGMTRQGLTGSSDAGTDIIMQDMGFGVSQRVEMERLKHAREQQIAATIEDISSIQKARVLLAMPKENVFARREKKASATVVLTAKRGKVIAGEEVDSVIDIVASAVQNMEPSAVTVTDSNGRLLNSGSQDSLSARARKEYEIERQREQEYLEKIDAILIPVLGIGNYTAQADVSMDFTALEQTQRSYNPDLPAVRSEMINEQNSVGGGAMGIPGALTNQPPLDSNIPENPEAGAQATLPGSTSKVSTRNYELDTTISHTKKQSGVIRRLSVSVAVDYLQVAGEDGTTSAEPRNQEALLNIRRLLQGGVGFDVTRGDSLEVVSVPFTRMDDGIIEDAPIWEQPAFLPILKLVIGGLVIIVLIIFVIRPMLRRLINPDESKEADDFDADEGLDLGDETISMLSTDFDEGQVGFAADGSLMLPDLHKDEDVLKAVRALVANEPELSAQVVKGWLMQDE
ncbi:flagellar basal-body MS-ring/collar protein FliF [Alteromonas stellipolaris]|jgi:flagellar M-ring protein FliF|uniref:flagellar basal-body MS-ring/collar protein FliF n=1 Tax=Alteromonas TaxID=226 RepID=UPI001DD21109|nr:flagellar basal-body MS-ring/collar protein FliF [Alteromonas stellipolaris]MBZ2163884.1 flagellar M-ring protein FliF [Alteromonas stellipolaris]MDO6536515.1 flagellar basal-body MS-ring/collar protein FliF [Alteromonas stellipolaris]MDO6540661.1 flagellar basal-body MS-ring/collar protein FliF [Alteromonas stellipolaris]MDO6625906.1 flagellar basal-body MS-ring/collar protein FliF [Alteromonas stellipolaris]MDP2537396.1 flagellar basal-body MS-ring/collar protein FliF [Alteromonas stellip